LLTITLQGLENISGFGPCVLRGARRGILAAAQSYTQDVKDWIGSGRADAPRMGETGHLRQSVGWRPEGRMSALVYVQAPYAPFVEEGTDPHIIRPRRRRALKIPNPQGGGYIIVAKVKHPGSKAKPFFFADMPARQGRMLEAFSAELGKAMEHEL
jgi:hypothetical protein